MVKSTRPYEQGQILLIIVLVMIVALTIGLSVVTRSITNLQISTEEENSQRALSAAEAGIEKALSSNQAGEIVGENSEIDLENNSEISNVNIETIGGTEFLVNNGNPVVKDDGADIWLSTYSEDTATNYGDPKYTGPMRVFWGSPGESCNQSGGGQLAALEIIVISGPNKNNPVVTHYPVDVCDERQRDNNFCERGDTRPVCQGITIRQETSTDQVLGKNFSYSVSIPVTNGMLARVIPLYGSTPLAVTNDGQGPDATFPLQGNVIESVGASGNTERKITVYRGFPQIPIEFFPYVLFSP